MYVASIEYYNIVQRSHAQDDEKLFRVSPPCTSSTFERRRRAVGRAQTDLGIRRHANDRNGRWMATVTYFKYIFFFYDGAVEEGSLRV